MNEDKLILVVDDDAVILEFVEQILIEQGYIVKKASNALEALKEIYQNRPDLIVLDYVMPDMDGYKFCLKLKEDIQLKSIPIIMLTSVGEIENKVKLMNAGADDYIVKPFHPKELVVRIKAVLRRLTENMDINLLTKLPGNVSINKEVVKRIKAKELFAFCYIDLSNFKVFNDRYGFEQGNKIIWETANILKKVVEAVGTEKDFIGHIGGDDFVAITAVDYVDRFCMEVINRFDFFVFGFYTPEEQKKGYVIGKDRKGYTQRFPIVKIHISVVTNEKKDLISMAQISSILAELKDKTKMSDKSNYIKNRRGK